MSLILPSLLCLLFIARIKSLRSLCQLIRAMSFLGGHVFHWCTHLISIVIPSTGMTDAIWSRLSATCTFPIILLIARLSPPRVPATKVVSNYISLRHQFWCAALKLDLCLVPVVVLAWALFSLWTCVLHWVSVLSPLARGQSLAWMPEVRGRLACQHRCQWTETGSSSAVCTLSLGRQQINFLEIRCASRLPAAADYLGSANQGG